MLLFLVLRTMPRPSAANTHPRARKDTRRAHTLHHLPTPRLPTTRAPTSSEASAHFLTAPPCVSMSLILVRSMSRVTTLADTSLAKALTKVLNSLLTAAPSSRFKTLLAPVASLSPATVTYPSQYFLPIIPPEPSYISQPLDWPPSHIRSLHCQNIQWLLQYQGRQTAAPYRRPHRCSNTE